MDLLDADDPAAWTTAESALREGGVVAVPTDTVYGVAAAVSRPAAVVSLFALKQRDQAKPLAVLVADAVQAATVATMGPVATRLAERFWPGALTLVVPRAPGFDVDLGGAGDTVGVRSPAHRGLVELCRQLGPLATTSANRSGRPTPPDGVGVAHELAGTSVELVVDGGPAPGGTASTVVRVDDGGGVSIIRRGPVTEVQLRSAVAGLA